MISLSERLARLAPAQRQHLIQKLCLQSFSIAPEPNSTPIVLSFAQQQMWLLNRLKPDSAAYNRPCNLGFRGILDVTALENSLNEILRRHDVLRACFPAIKDEPSICIQPELKIQLNLLDLRDLPDPKQYQSLQQIAQAEVQKPFDLSQGPSHRSGNGA
jgi:hypothetical protein